MRFLRTNTAVIITVGPFYDKTDGVTIETALTITNERITLTADTDAGSAPTNILDNIAGATAATANDLNYITGNDAGMMQLELAAADVNRLGRMFLSITDAANHVPVFHEFMVLPAMIYDAFILGTDVLDASVTQILGTAVSTPATAGILDVNVKNIDNDAAAASGTVTFPNATLASTANITAGTITTATNVTTVNGLAANVITAASMAADASAEIADAVWDEDATGHQTGGTFGQAIGDPVADTNTIYKAVVTDAAGATVGVDVVAVKAETAAILVDTGTTLDAALAVVDANVDAILVDTAEIGAAGAGLTAINLPNQTMDIVGNITGNLSGSVGSVTGAVGSVTGAVGSVTGAVGSVTAGVTVTTNNDKTGYALSSAAVQAMWDALTSALTTVGSIGKWLVDKLDVVVSTRLATSGYTVPPTAAANADAVWDEALADHLTAGTTGAGLNAAGSAGDPWATALPGAYGAGTAGKIVGDNVNAPIATVDTVVDAIKVQTDQLAFTVANQLDSNVQSVNDVTVVGDGAATKWGP